LPVINIPGEMATKKMFDVTCACCKKNFPVVVNITEKEQKAAARKTIDLICPYSSTGKCEYPLQLLEVTIPVTAKPGESIYNCVKKTAPTKR
jgi:hypothetical protein